MDLEIKIGVHCHVCSRSLDVVYTRPRLDELYVLPCENGCDRELYKKNQKERKKKLLARLKANEFEDFSLPRCRADLPYNTR